MSKKIVSVSKARQLYAILKSAIENGEYAPGDKIPSIRDLAMTYELSKNTVNTVIAMLVNEGLLTIREGMGTHVSIEPKKLHMIGVMIFDFGKGMRVDTSILECIQQNVASNYYLSLADTSNHYDSFCDGLDHLLDMGASGMLIIPPKETPTPDQLQRAKNALAKRPVVFMNRAIEGVEADTYSMDLAKGIENAFEYFATSGKRRTALVLHDTDKFVQEELEAYERCARLLGFEMDADLFIPWDDDPFVVRDQVVSRFDHFDSLIAPDMVFPALQEVLIRSGKMVPGDLSLVGINNTIVSRMFYPPLTSIAFPVERIARHSINKLIRRIEMKETKPFATTNFTPEFIIRST